MKKTQKKTSARNSNKVPAGALCLGFEGPTALTEFAGEGDDKKPTMNMVIYSGGIIKNHYWWDDLVLDLSGVSFPKKKFPILEDHNRSKKIAFHDGPPIVDKNLRVDPTKVSFVSTKESEEFQTLSSEGFPYEASARVSPSVIERVAEGATVDVNGFKLKGPGTVFRKWAFVEGSVCVFGYDRNTESISFSEEEVELDCEFLGEASETKFSNNDEGVKNTMDIETLQKEHPDLYAKIRKDAFSEAQKEQKPSAELDTRLQELSGTVTQLQQTVEQQSKTITELNNKNLELEKDNTIRTEAEMKSEAGRIWIAKLSKSEIPDHMHEKVQKHVAHSQFIDAETGKCDWEKFSEAVDANIKSWEEDLGKFSSSVKGGGYSSRTDEADDHQDDTELKAEDDWVNEMAGMVEDPDDNGGAA